MQLHIPFSEISEYGIQFSITDRSWLSNDLLDTIGQFSADVELTRKSERRIEVQGELHAEIRLDCDRCLAVYRYPLAARLQLIVELPETGRHWRLQDMEIDGSGSDLDTLSVSEPVLDLADILHQQLYLALPAKRLCRENCLGLCSHCGANLNEGRCACHGDIPANSPFAVLALYGKKKKRS